ncbi:MAG: hypothetical protein EBV23_08185 [Flavobacteriia bacterium]|nr:hypothetical protein [Flavobacteriia bacterium]
MNQSFSFSGIDVLIFVLYLGFLWVGSSRIKKRYSSDKLNPFFHVGWLFKVTFSLLFAYVYLFLLGGGDINAYWMGASCLADLFYADPVAYFSELLHTNRSLGVAHHFNSFTGYPPGWIWREEEAWFATKIISIFAIVTFKGFWSATLLLSTLGFWVTWLFSLQLHVKESFSRNSILAALFFVPSVSFWCSGISKDSLTFSLAIFTVFIFFNLLKWGNSRGILQFLLVLFLIYLIYSLRHYLAYAISAPFVLAWMGRFGKRFTERPLLLWIFRLVIYALFLATLGLLINADKTQELIAEANITKSDFSSNPIYSGAKYEMPSTTGAPLEILSILPLAIFTALFRPSFFDNVTTSFIINQVESFILLLFLIRFVIRKNIVLQMHRILRDEFLLYALFFILLVSFMAGYSSILFGVLVRIRSIALPFLILLLLHQKSSTETPT